MKNILNPISLCLILPLSVGIYAESIGQNNPNIEVLSELIRTDDTGKNTLTLSVAMSEAMRNNYLGRISREDITAARAGIDQTRGFLLPRVEGGASYERVDDERNAVRNGFTPRSQTSLDLRATQMIYNDSRVTEFRQSRRELDVAREKNAAVELSVAEEAALAYIDVLSVQSLLRIEDENLRITQKNLELAQIRNEVGTAGPEEVLRFESEEAQQQSTLWATRNRLSAAINRLNVSLGLDPGERWKFQDLSLTTPEFATVLTQWSDTIQTREEADAFRRASVLYALHASPEIAALRASSDIRQMELDQNRRGFFVPDVGASFLFQRILDSEYSNTAAEVNQERNSWTFLLGATIPLFEGGTRYGNIRLSRAELRRLEWEEALIRQQIANRVEDALSAMASSYLSIHLSRRASKSADENLRIVQDKYEQGSVSIIDLLDAQNNAVFQRQSASIALYDFFRDLLQYQRQLGWIEPIASESSRIDFLKDFQNRLSQTSPNG